MNNLKKKRVDSIRFLFKWLSVVLIAIISYIFMTTGKGNLPLPLLYIPLTIGVASKCQPFVAGVWGCIFGLMLDSACSTLFGFYGVILMGCGVIISLMFQYFLRQNFFNIVILNLIVIPLQGIVDFVLNYSMWGYEDSSAIWLGIFLPQMIITFLFAPPVYLLIWLIFKRFGVFSETFIEEKSEDIVRE